MMDNIESALRVLFKRVSSQEIIKKELLVNDLRKEEFVQLMRSYSNRYSDTELTNLYRYLVFSFKELFRSTEHSMNSSETLDVFQLLSYYAEWILVYRNDELVCPYDRFLHWRMISLDLSEDLLTCSFFAIKECRLKNVRMRYDWKVMITHDNKELHRILDRGMAENHSHLKGAPALYPLTWISLMNNLEFHKDIVGLDRDRRTVNVKYSMGYKEETLQNQLLQAVYIRLMLFVLINKKAGNSKIWMELENCRDYLENPVLLQTLKGRMSDFIHTLQWMFSQDVLPDYAMAGPLHEGVDQNGDTLIYQGERWLLYHVFLLIYSGSKLIRPYLNYFYAYLLIKETLRGEIVQCNDSVGFENFRIYESRKDIFLENDFFKKMQVKKAVETSLFESNVVVYEGRIAPKDTMEKMRDMIISLDDRIGKNLQSRFFYVVHFIKKEEQLPEGDFIECRHVKERQSYRKQALALVRLREEEPEIASRIRGIDAANAEIVCSPENFAQVFRFLSDHVRIVNGLRDIRVPQLRKTYHVGEDYLDLISGIRAIDEAVRFLGLKNGDRLGHAIALGIDVRWWYAKKNQRIILSKQEYLDNLAWMYHYLIYLKNTETEHFENYILKEFSYHFQLVYLNAVSEEELKRISERAREHYKETEWEKYYGHYPRNFSINDFYVAWKLRSDNPELYKKGYFENDLIIDNNFKEFDYYGINREIPLRQNKRYLQENAVLNYLYHFNKNVRVEGARPIEIKVTEEYIFCAELLQRVMQQKIVKKGISIETNPSSNFLISQLEKYENHPIVNFYNRNLTDDSEKLEKCMQLDVSINTDDGGIFSTSLENEYAYLALALEKAKNEDGKPKYKKKNIYAWIDDIRRMGMNQTFLSDRELKCAIDDWKNQNKGGLL